MKLRIKGDSLRLRVSPSEMARLLRTGRIEEAVHFAPEPDALLTYALEHAATDEEISVRYRPQEVTVVLSTEGARKWAGGDQVGVHGVHKVGDGTLELLVEKDFACLEGKDADNEDTFANPSSGAVC
jgi:hypothetical protein